MYGHTAMSYYKSNWQMIFIVKQSDKLILAYPFDRNKLYDNSKLLRYDISLGEYYLTYVNIYVSDKEWFNETDHFTELKNPACLDKLDGCLQADTKPTSVKIERNHNIFKNKGMKAQLNKRIKLCEEHNEKYFVTDEVKTLHHVTGKEIKPKEEPTLWTVDLNTIFKNILFECTEDELEQNVQEFVISELENLDWTYEKADINVSKTMITS